MFNSTYQGGHSVEVFNAKDVRNCPPGSEKSRFYQSLISFSASTQYTYNEQLKSYVLTSQSKSSCINIPANTKQHLSLSQPILSLQLKLPEQWSITFIVQDYSNTQRRLVVCNTVGSVKKQHFCTQVPAPEIPTGVWVNMHIEMARFQLCGTWEAIIITQACELRRIITCTKVSAMQDHYPAQIPVEDWLVTIDMEQTTCQTPQQRIKSAQDLNQVQEPVKQIKPSQKPLKRQAKEQPQKPGKELAKSQQFKPVKEKPMPQKSRPQQPMPQQSRPQQSRPQQSRPQQSRPQQIKKQENIDMSKPPSEETKSEEIEKVAEAPAERESEPIDELVDALFRRKPVEKPLVLVEIQPRGISTIIKEGGCTVVQEKRKIAEEGCRMVYDPWLQRYIDINTGIQYQ